MDTLTFSCQERELVDIVGKLDAMIAQASDIKR